MTDPVASASAPFITFYSFKGGVGRSMALVNIAGILAGRGFRVLAIDFDLEAPGISYLMGKDRLEHYGSFPGVVDLLLDAKNRGEEGDLFALEPQDILERYSYHYDIPEEIQQSDEGSLRIMPAGRFDPGYAGRLDELVLQPGLNY